MAGHAAAKAELAHAVGLLRLPRDAPWPRPRSFLLSGPAGTGKATLARAVAGEAGVPAVSGHARDAARLAARAAECAPCVLVLRADPVGGDGGAWPAPPPGVVLAVVVDDGAGAGAPACRLDRHVRLGLPDVADRRAILAASTAGLPLSPGAGGALDRLARASAGLTGADVVALAAEAGALAARDRAPAVLPCHLDEALGRVAMSYGSTPCMSERCRQVAAVHEAGHAVAAIRAGGALGAVRSVSILPGCAGQPGGQTVLESAPPAAQTRAHLEGHMVVLLAGRAAEELVFGADAVTVGASHDLQAVYELARRAVVTYGFTDDKVLGAMAPGPDAPLSPGMAYRVDCEVRRVIGACYARARNLLTANMRALQTVASELLERESLTGDEARALMR